MTTSILLHRSWPAFKGSVVEVVRWGSLALLLVLFTSSGCQTNALTMGHNIRFHLEAAEGSSMNTGSIPMRMPLSGVVLKVEPSPVLTESDIIDVQWVRVGSSFRAPFTFQPGLLMRFRFNVEGSEVLEQLSKDPRGVHLVLIIDGDPMGAVLLEAPVNDGELHIAPEIRAQEVPERVDSLRRSIYHLKQARQED